MQISFYIVLAVIAVWSLYGYFSSRVEQATYSVIKKSDKGYEIRDYPAHIVAETTVSGSYEVSMSTGFRIVAGYIFGGNTKQESIPMTAPVVIQEKELEKKSENIAMTAPVIMRNEGDSRVVSFGMPKSYTLQTLPTPTDSRVKIVEVPHKKYAVIQFSGYRTNARIQKMEEKLLHALAKDGVKIIGIPSYAGYNAPWTPPWMIRNEVLIEVNYL